MDENQDSISLHPFELAQKFENHLDILSSYPFLKIELDLECDPEPHISDPISLFDSIMAPVSLPDFFLYSGFNIESCTSTPWNGITNLSWSHFIHGESVCEHQFFGLDLIFEPISTPLFESRLDLSQIPESISVFVPDPFESKSLIFQNHTSLLDKDVEENDSVIIFEN